MNYLSAIYKNADKYIGGLPVDIVWQEEYDEFYSHFIKYAIADFDGDSQNELMLFVDNHVPGGGPSIVICERIGAGVSEEFVAHAYVNNEAYNYMDYGMFYNNLNDYKFTFYNNGVIAHDNAITIFQEPSKRYITRAFYIFNKQILNRLGIEQGGIVTYEKNGNGMKRIAFYQEALESYLTNAQYNEEIKLLTSGKKLNVNLKYFNANDLGL